MPSKIKGKKVMGLTIYKEGGNDDSNDFAGLWSNIKLRQHIK